MNKLKNRLGEKYTTNENYEVEIIECFKGGYYTVQFKDGGKVFNRNFSDIKNGEIRNLNHKSVFGVGYEGYGKYIRKYYKLSNNRWRGMLGRCYDKNYQFKKPTYKDCSVDERWHNFQVFAEWFEENYDSEIMKGWHLDKDILIKGNKIYSPETCCFVPSAINQIFAKVKASRGDLPIGVVKNGNNYMAQISIKGENKSLGTYSTPEEAFKVYKTTKESWIKEMAEIWKPKLALQTYQALINYKVEITD